MAQPGIRWWLLLIVLCILGSYNKGQTQDVSATGTSGAEGGPATSNTSSSTPSPGDTATTTPSPGDTATPILSPGDTATPTPSPGDTATTTPSPGDTATPTPSPGDTATTTPSPGDTATPTPSPADTATTTPSPADTATPTPSPSDTATPTPSPGDTATPTPSPSDTATTTPSPGDTATTTPSPGDTATTTPSPADTATPTPSPADTATTTPSPGDTGTTTPSPGDTGTTTPSPADTATPTPSPSDIATPTPSPSDTATPTPSPADTATPTPSPSDTATPTPSPSDTDTPTPSPGDTATPTPSPADTATTTPSPSDTATPTPSPADTATPTPSPSDTATPTPSPSDTATPTPSPSDTATPTPSPSDTATTTPSPSDTATTTPSPADTATPTPSPGDSAASASPAITSIVPTSASSTGHSSQVSLGENSTQASTSDGTTSSITNSPATSLSSIKTTSQANPTTPPIPRKYVKKLSDLAVNLPFTIKFSNETFKKELRNRSSPEYQNRSSYYKEKLTEVFNDTTGFKTVHITGFWPGSLGVDYNVEYEYSAVPNISSELTKEKLLLLLKNISGVDEAYIENVVSADLSRAQKILTEIKDHPCSGCELWNCTKTESGQLQSCVSPCYYSNCQEPHVCFLDIDGKPRCQCKSDENYIYDGEFCEVKTEKLKLSSTTIIAIACGIGGGLVLILSIALIVSCCRHRRRRGKMLRGFDDQKSDVSFQSMTGMQPLSMAPTADNRLYRHTGEGIAVASFTRHDTGLPTTDPVDRSVRQPDGTRPEEETKLTGQMRYGEDGRMYRVIKDSQLYKGTEGSLSYRNQGFDSYPEETALSDVGVTKPAYPRPSYKGSKDRVYKDPSDGTSQTFMYQPSDVVPRTPFGPALTHINPVAAADPNELSGFPRRDDVKRLDDVKRVSDDRSRSGSTAAYSDRWMQESYPRSRDEHPGAPVKVYPDRDGKPYPAKEPDYPRKESFHSGRLEPDYPTRDPVYPARDPVYPAREPGYLSMESSYLGIYRGNRESGYSGREEGRSRAVLPGEPHEAQNPLIHDFSDKGGVKRQQHGGSDKRGPARVYDFVPEAGKLSIQQPVFSNRPVY